MHYRKRIAKMEAKLSNEYAQCKPAYISLSETPKGTPEWTELNLSIRRHEEEIRLLQIEISQLKDVGEEDCFVDFTTYEQIDRITGETKYYKLVETVRPDGSTFLKDVQYFPGEDS